MCLVVKVTLEFKKTYNQIYTEQYFGNDLIGVLQIINYYNSYCHSKR